MIVLQFIGPTGVGKSHWGKWLAQALSQDSPAYPVSFYDLDHLIAIPPYTAEALLLDHGPHYFWERSLQALGRLHGSGDSCIVATGAGTQWAACLFKEYARLLAFPTCTLWCEPSVLLGYLQRQRADQRSLADLKYTEYSLERTFLYDQGFRIDRTSLSEPQLKTALKAAYALMT